MRLIYWNKLPGRGEYIRLMLEEAGVAYADVCRDEADNGAVVVRMQGKVEGDPIFAPPILEVDGLRLSQVAAISHYLGPKLGLVPNDAAEQARALQHVLSVADLVSEIHDTHHPVSTALFYEQQRDEAIQAAKLFRAHRLVRWLRYFERVIAHRQGGGLLGEFSYPDLHLFHTVRGLRYAFPNATAAALEHTPQVAALAEAVAQRPNIAAYLASSRCMAFNADGLFRAYPELDGPVG